MLSSFTVRASLPALDIERARAFYADKLGLTPLAETPGGLVYESGVPGSPASPGWPARGNFLLYPTPNPARGGHNQMGFLVDDMASVVEGLSSRGVVFEAYDFPGCKTVDGIAEMAGGSLLAAWFKDSEGNLIGLIQPVG